MNLDFCSCGDSKKASEDKCFTCRYEAITNKYTWEEDQDMECPEDLMDLN